MVTKTGQSIMTGLLIRVSTEYY